ncbi:aldo/keto reductase [Cellvibrio sp. NN19]|uniref:aldo/keto reductase n=1 Tax=Cellvibrio chitinivorans TaxID=3102792 RepID=UPI002B40232B|nr:aldo/keto reductase [Cellvibrio sp. NN19]
MMPRKRLGHTDVEISTFGLGTVKFGRTQSLKYPQPFSLPNDEQLRELLACARDMGVNYLDTAPSYGYSEERLGDLLRKERKDWVISTKVGEEFEASKFSDEGVSRFDFSAKHTRMSVERSLRRLRTDYLDLVMIHSDGNDLDILLNSGALQTLQQLKQEGWIRALGISSKTLEGGLLAAEVCDAVMLMYHADYTDEAPVIAKSAQQGTGVLLKKVLASGHICHDAPRAQAAIHATDDSEQSQDQEQDPIQRAFNFAYAPTGVTSAVVGTVNMQHLRANLIKALRAQNRA